MKPNLTVALSLLATEKAELSNDEKTKLTDAGLSQTGVHTLMQGKAIELALSLQSVTQLAKLITNCETNSDCSSKDDNAASPAVDSDKGDNVFNPGKIATVARRKLAERALAKMTVEDIAKLARGIDLLKDETNFNTLLEYAKLEDVAAISDISKNQPETDLGNRKLNKEEAQKFEKLARWKLAAMAASYPFFGKCTNHESDKKENFDYFTSFDCTAPAKTNANGEFDDYLRYLSTIALANLARETLIDIALGVSKRDDFKDVKQAGEELAKLYVLGVVDEKGIDFDVSGDNPIKPGDYFLDDDLARLAVLGFVDSLDETTASNSADTLITLIVFGEYGTLDSAVLRELEEKFSEVTLTPKALFIFLLAVVIWIACWMTVDVNLTSIHGLYRDRLASAFLVGQDTKGDVDIEEDVDLEDICRYEARSTAPYHLINVALNLQGSRDISIRDRNSDFFIFSKRFIGGERTGYCRSETMEQVFPQMSLATAMAISAAAASPNMGRGTTPVLVAFMTLLNIRLGFWLPNPGLVEEQQGRRRWKLRKEKTQHGQTDETEKPLGLKFEEVFHAELEEIERRWDQVYPEVSRRHAEETRKPSARHGLLGIGFSGGGIRSATINLGIVQVLHKRGIFDHVDYMSTVSGGGYLGSSISTLMRTKTKLASEIEGTITVEELGTENVVTVSGGRQHAESKSYHFSRFAELDVEDGENVSAGRGLIKRRGASSLSPHAGTVKVQRADAYDQIVWVSGRSGDERVYLFSKADQLEVKTGDSVIRGQELHKPEESEGTENTGGNRGTTTSDISGTVKVDTADAEEQFVSIASQSGTEVHVHRFSRFDRLTVKTGDSVKAGQELVQRQNTVGDQFRWRVRPSVFLREMTSRLDEKHRWVNLSDGGHIENLATIELLRRRCKYIIIGDAEADPNLHFNGLATLIRTAWIDFGIDIDINLDTIRLQKNKDNEDKLSREHWAVGKITYPEEDENGNHECGNLLYLKSSFTGDEGEMILEYRHRAPDFPHQSTADQMFDEGQFEAYRALGQHIAEQALKHAPTEPLTSTRGRVKKKKKAVVTTPAQTAPDTAPSAYKLAYADLDRWFKGLNEYHEDQKQKARSKRGR